MEYWASFAVINLSIILSMYLIQNKKNNKSKFKFFCYSILSFIFLIVVSECIPPVFRVLLNLLIYMIDAKLLFDLNIKRSFIIGIFITMLVILSEIIYAIMVIPLLIGNKILVDNCLVVFVNNFLISLILVLVSLFIKIKGYYLKLLKSIDKISEKKIIVFFMLIVILFNFLGWIIYIIAVDLANTHELFLISSFLSVFSSLLVYIYLKTNNQYLDISEKYDLSMASIKDYEQIIENNRVHNHEIRNQFLMLRNMSRNNKVNNYIDSILNTKINDNEDLLNSVIGIPSGGLRGLIYAKMLTMKEQKINYELYVDKKINVRKFNKVDYSTIVDICKIVGVFLDNAIEAVSILKEKNITIELYLDGKDIIIAISNNFVGAINVEKFKQSGYTTKSNEHGYGLKLVDNILNHNNKLENYIELYENNFTQNLKIKM